MPETPAPESAEKSEGAIDYKARYEEGQRKISEMGAELGQYRKQIEEAKPQLVTFEQALETAALPSEAVAESVSKTGTVSPDQREALQKAGFSDDQIDNAAKQYRTMQDAARVVADVEANKIKDTALSAAGGDAGRLNDAIKLMENLPEDVRTNLTERMQSSATVEGAVIELLGRVGGEIESTRAPVSVGKSPAAIPARVFTSQSDMHAEMKRLKANGIDWKKSTEFKARLAESKRRGTVEGV